MPSSPLSGKNLYKPYGSMINSPLFRKKGERQSEKRKKLEYIEEDNCLLNNDSKIKSENF